MNYRRDYIIIHHTGAEEKNARQVKQYHLSKGWRDVGYNYIIERDGKVVPGRSLEIPGAHTRASGMNYKSIGIALIGNFQNHCPTERQFAALVDLVTWCQQKHNIPTTNVLLHREVPGAHTLCPGRYFPAGELRLNLTDPAHLWCVQVKIRNVPWISLHD